MARIHRRHFNSTAKRLGYGETAEPLIQEIIERTPAVIDEVQPVLPPGFSEEVAVKVLGGLRTAARVLEAMPADGSAGRAGPRLISRCGYCQKNNRSTVLWPITLRPTRKRTVSSTTAPIRFN